MKIFDEHAVNLKKIKFSQMKYFSPNLKFYKLQFNNIYQTKLKKTSGPIIQIEIPE